MIGMENSELFQLLLASNINSSSFFNNSTPPSSSVVTSTTMHQSLCISSSNNNNSYNYNNNNNYNYNPLELSEISDAISQKDRALAAMKNHKEAEKRRRERINSHLNELRAILPCNSKTDKASLLAKVVERVKELKQQTSTITDIETLPSETDEISIHSAGGGDDGRLIFKASLCCEDRSDLIPDLIEILNSLHLKTLKAEMVTLGGRTRNVLVVAADKDHSVESIHFIQNSFKSLLERSNSSSCSSSCSDRSKRRRGFDRRLQ